MNRSKVIKSMTIGALFSIISTLFQTAPIYLPVIGLILSPFSTLPIIIAGISSFYLALSVYFCSAFLILIISLEEALIFIFATGLIGIAISIFINKKNPILFLLTSTIFLTSGILLLTYIFQIAGFIELAKSTKFLIYVIIVLAFSLLYSCLLHTIFRKLKKYFYNINKIP